MTNQFSTKKSFNNVLKEDSNDEKKIIPSRYSAEGINNPYKYDKKQINLYRND